MVLHAAHGSSLLTCCSAGQTLLQGGFMPLLHRFTASPFFGTHVWLMLRCSCGASPCCMGVAGMPASALAWTASCKQCSNRLGPAALSPSCKLQSHPYSLG